MVLRQETVDRLVNRITGGRNPFGARLPRGVEWERRGSVGQRRLVLRPTSGYFNELVKAELALTPPTVDDPQRVRATITILANPTRLRSRMGPQGWEQWNLPARLNPSDARPDHLYRHDNSLPDELLLHPGADFHWVDDAADLLQNMVALIAESLFARTTHGMEPVVSSGSLTSVSLQQVECYWEFTSEDPDGALEGLLLRGMQGGGDAQVRRHEQREVDGRTVVEAWLTRASQTSIVFYGRGNRLRAEVRYKTGVSRSAPGAGRGCLRERFRAVATNAAPRLNRVLRATAPHRRETLLLGSGSAEVFMAALTRVLGADRAVEASSWLLRHRNIQTGPNAIVTTPEAERLVRLGILDRRPVRARDPGGRRFALHSGYDCLPDRWR
jgi:hypothetical protein